MIASFRPRKGFYQRYYPRHPGHGYRVEKAACPRGQNTIHEFARERKYPHTFMRGFALPMLPPVKFAASAVSEKIGSAIDHRAAPLYARPPFFIPSPVPRLLST